MISPSHEYARSNRPREASIFSDVPAILYRLTDLQATTLAMVGRGRELLDRGPIAARGRFQGLCGELTDGLETYQAFKHGRIFDPAIASGSPSLREAARCLKADCVAGGVAFRQFVRHWRGREPDRVWDEFRPAMLGLGTRLRDHIRAEDVQIRLLLAEARRSDRVHGGAIH